MNKSLKILINETQYKHLLRETNLEKSKLFFRRNYDSLIVHLWDIIVEGFYNFDICDYKEFKEYYDFIIESSVETFIYSYNELGGYNDLSSKEFLEKLTKDRYGKYIKKWWRERECE